ncbi:MAG TPA: prepilin-type N-terminal cleavage/methylation domain-containing protein [Acidobacteriota bacterium]|jgi:type IV pilus modification protein PilV
MKTKKPNSRGFTLLESLIGILVLAIGLLGLAQLLGIAVTQSGASREMTMATSVALDQMERLKALYNNDLKTSANSGDLSSGNHGPTTVKLVAPANTNQGDYEFLVSWIVVNSGLEKKITLTVEHPRVTDVVHNRTVQLVNYLAP